LDIQLVSIAIDPVPALAEDAERLKITTPFLSDKGSDVSDQYGVLQWAMPSGEPGHTFVLVDGHGIVRWVKDYGAPKNGGLMYVEVDELYSEIRALVEA
jgi:peroxiredoxin